MPRIESGAGVSKIHARITPSVMLFAFAFAEA
jgi:hypothetical protein